MESGPFDLGVLPYGEAPVLHIYAPSLSQQTPSLIPSLLLAKGHILSAYNFAFQLVRLCL